MQFNVYSIQFYTTPDLDCKINAVLTILITLNVLMPEQESNFENE